MAALEQVTQMQQQGMPDEEIARTLQEQGVSPREIDDALNQSRVKSAVAGESDMAPQATDAYTPQTQEMEAGYQTPAPETGANYAAATETDTIIEISEQVFSEKIKKIQNQVEAVNEFKSLAGIKIDNLEERLKRIESLIDKLQVEIIAKVGSYGKDLKKTRKELDMVQNSFQKMVNPLANKPRKTTSRTKRKT
jgi:DNA-binding transcriptional MerR regulator